MNLFITWLPETLPEAERDAVPLLSSALHIVRTARPAEAAIKAADRASRTKHPFFVTVAVMRAEELGSYSPKIRKYKIMFRRSSEIVKQSSIG